MTDRMIQILNLPMTKKYNNSQKRYNTQNILQVCFVCHAKRNPKNTFFLRWNTSHSLRRDVADSAFLQKDQTQQIVARAYSNGSEESGLPFFRTHSCSFVRHHHGAEAAQQNRYSSIQWILSGNDGTGTVSRSIHTASFSETTLSQKNSSTGQTPRQLESASIRLASQTHHFGFRYRFGGHCDLRKPRRCADRLQSKEARKTILSSSFLFRSAFSGILAWHFKTGEHCQFYRSRSFYQNMSEKSSAGHCNVSYSISNGFRILRSTSHSISREQGMRICDCGQRIFHNQIPHLIQSPNYIKRTNAARRTSNLLVFIHIN